MHDTAQLIILASSPDMAQRLEQTLSLGSLPIRTVTAPDADAVAAALADQPFDVLVTDSGRVRDVTFMDAVREAAPDLSVVALENTPDGQGCMDVVMAGADGCLGIDELDRLPAVVTCCLRVSRLLKERRRFREGMAEFKARFNHLFENSPDALVILDDDHRILETNESFQAIFRYSQDEVKGMVLGDVVVPDDLRPEYEKYAANIRAGIMVRTETVRTRKDGSPVHVAIQACPIMLQEGTIGSYASYTDISSRIRALEALRRAESKYRSIFDNAVEGMYISTPFGRFVTVNKAMSDLLGYDSPSDLTDNIKSIRREIYAEPGMRDDFRRRIERTGTVSGFVSRVRRKNGDLIEVVENVRAVHDDDGDLLYFQGTMQALPHTED